MIEYNQQILNLFSILPYGPLQGQMGEEVGGGETLLPSCLAFSENLRDGRCRGAEFHRFLKKSQNYVHGFTIAQTHHKKGVVELYESQ